MATAVKLNHRCDICSQSAISDETSLSHIDYSIHKCRYCFPSFIPSQKFYVPGTPLWRIWQNTMEPYRITWNLLQLMPSLQNSIKGIEQIAQFRLLFFFQTPQNSLRPLSTCLRLVSTPRKYLFAVYIVLDSDQAQFVPDLDQISLLSSLCPEHTGVQCLYKCTETFRACQHSEQWASSLSTCHQQTPSLLIALGTVANDVEHKVQFSCLVCSQLLPDSLLQYRTSLRPVIHPPHCLYRPAHCSKQ